MTAIKQPHDESALNRKRQSVIKTTCSVSEYEQIKTSANQAGMSVARFLRAVAMGYPVISALDTEAVRQLSKVNGDLARLGNLQKLWLDNDARTAGLGTAQVNRLLQRIEDTQSELRRQIKALSAGSGQAI